MIRTDLAHWEQIWLAEAVRVEENGGPLDDAATLARVQRMEISEKAQLLERAWLLGERLGWSDAMNRVRDAGWLMLLLLAGAVVALTNGLLFSVLTDGRTINAASGFFSALAFHSISMMFWLVSIPLARTRNRHDGGGMSIGRWLIAAMARLPFGRTPQTGALVKALKNLVLRERLSPWAFGLVSHLVWAFGFTFMLLGLIFAFSFREYQLTWETTLLGPDWFVGFARVTGYVPGLLGVPVPNLPTAEAARVLGSPPALRGGAWPAKEAAAWLLACVALYGLLPRIACAAWCACILRRAAHRVDIDLADPYYQRLRTRLQALEIAEVTDMERQALFGAEPVRRTSEMAHAGLAVVGFELMAEDEWLGEALRSKAQLAVRIAGTMAERNQLQASLAAQKPAQLLVVCNANASPDRGTLRFLREAAFSASQCALTFSAPRAGDHAQPTAVERSDGIARWRAWVIESELSGWQVFDRSDAAETWLLAKA